MKSRDIKRELVDIYENWEDPNPPPVLKEHEGFIVVRDDLLGPGSKVRFLDYLVSKSSEKEFVFGGCPATGYAQISLPALTNKYGKSTHLFMAKRDPAKYTEYQKRGMALGANYHWVPDGMLNVTKARAREYVEADPSNRILMNLGLCDPTAIACIAKVAQSLPIDEPKEFWTVGSSGTLNRGLQLAWPNAVAHVVQVGHSMSKEEVGRAILWKCPLAFDKPTKEPPPFPSALTYDAKCWGFMKVHAKPGALMWNVGA